MTQEAVIRCLQNGPLTSYQLEDLTGIPRLSIAACCTKMSYKKKLKIGKIKLGRSWVSQYTLEPHMTFAMPRVSLARLNMRLWTHKPRDCLVNRFHKILQTISLFDTMFWNTARLGVATQLKREVSPPAAVSFWENWNMRQLCTITSLILVTTTVTPCTFPRLRTWPTGDCLIGTTYMNLQFPST